jgi:hypothetical protein
MRELLAAGSALVLALSGLVIGLRSLDYLENRQHLEIRYEPQVKKSVPSPAEEPKE